jgi:TonB family protein
MPYHRAMRPLFLLVLLLGCAGTTAKGPKSETVTDCPAAVAAEREKAAREGRPPVPIIQRGALTTNLFDDRNRPHVTLEMAKEARSATLKMLARISVRTDGSVQSVEVIKSSGSPSFDTAVTEKMKTWTHRPSAIDCRPVPYAYPMNWQHKYSP